MEGKWSRNLILRVDEEVDGSIVFPDDRDAITDLKSKM